MGQQTPQLKYPVVGLTGTNAAGKGEVAKLLAGWGYQYFSLSDILRQELEARHLPANRENLIAVGNELRSAYGFAVLAQRTRAKIGPETRAVIDSIRSPHEAKELKKIPGFILLAVDAPAALRFQRAKARGRPENASTLEAFVALERRESSAKDGEQQLDQVMALAERTIQNDGSLADLAQKVMEVLS